ncbi:DUF6541 family protein [Arthrobacter sp. 2MCAF15]|uniref:DUF6541 family protein n=1 Tax=Arthrobacter sp. 2MCAF15 TaxID=3232984 RepID=UPI003F8E44CB
MWLSVLPQVLIACVVLVMPGLIIAIALRFRGFSALALAPALTVGVVVITSTLTPFLKVRFGVLPVAAVAVALALLGLWAARFRPSGPAKTGPNPLNIPDVRGDLTAFAGVVIAGALLAVHSIHLIGSPEAISQTYDAVFHLNSVKFALDTGQASSLTLGAMTGGGAYPAGWNAVATLVALATGASVPLSVNITSIVLAAVFWPLGCMLLAKWVVGDRPAALIATGIASASLGAFPLLMMDFGVLYPNLLAISVLPASVALAASCAGLTPGLVRRDLATILALLLALAGLIVAHPTTFMAWLTWTLPMVATLAWHYAAALRRKQAGARLYVTRLVLPAVAYAVAFSLLWTNLRPPLEASFWGPYQSIPKAIGEAVTISPTGLSLAWLVAPLVLLGLWACFQDRWQRVWIAAVFALFTYLFVVVSGFTQSETRDLLTGVWYNDSYRIAALLPVVAVLLVAVGIDWAGRRILAVRERSKPLERVLDGSPRWGRTGTAAYRTVGIAAVVVAAVALGQQGGLELEVEQGARNYKLAADSPLVSTDELQLMKRLPQSVPEGALLIDNPYTGAALSYALGDRKSAQLHVMSYVSPDVQRIYDSIGNVTTDASVCQAVRNANAFYILDFGPIEVHGGNHTPAGLRNLASNPGVRLVDSQGEAKLYKVTACGN